jgi:hypothetical protein
VPCIAQRMLLPLCALFWLIDIPPLYALLSPGGKSDEKSVVSQFGFERLK